MTGNMIRLNDQVVPELRSRFLEHESDLLRLKNDISEKCNINDAFGFVLQGLKGQYVEARNHTLEVVQDSADLTRILADKVEAYQGDAEQNEQDIVDQLNEILQAVEAIAAESSSQGATAGVGSATGASSTGGAGGNGAAGASDGSDLSAPQLQAVTPTASATPTVPVTPVQSEPSTRTEDLAESMRETLEVPADGIPERVVGIDSDGDGETDLTVHVDADEPLVFERLNPDTDEVETVQLPGLTPEEISQRLHEQQEAADATFEQAFWEEMAKHDALSRSADELQRLWEDRDIQDDVVDQSLGHGADRPTISFGLDGLTD